MTTAVIAVAGCRSGGQTARGDAGIDRPDDAAVTGDAAVDVDAPAPADAGVDSSPDATAGADATAGTPAALCRAAIEAQCRRQVACRGADMDGCVATAVGYCPSYYFNSRSLRTVADIEACLPAFAAMTCTDIAMGLTPPCLRLGNGTAGSSCLYNTECEFGCPNGTSACATCGSASRAAAGALCDATHLCASTDYCHSVTKTCVAKASVAHAAEGQACDFGASPPVGCQGDLVCARTSAGGTAGTCRPIPQLDQPCANSGDFSMLQQCGAGLACNTQSMTCRPAPPPSSGCGDGGVCGDASFCRGALTANAICVPRALEGQPCDLGIGSQPAVSCTLGLRCVITADAGYSGICTRPGSVGDACDKAHPCGGSLCSVSGRCVAYDPAGCQP